MLSSRVPEVRSQIERCRRGRSQRAVRYPPNLRHAVVELTRSALTSGSSVRIAAEKVGLPLQTVQRWLQATVAGGLRPIEVRSEEPVEAINADSGLVLVTPGGYRVEGLEVESVAALLRALAS